ncbi:MAG: hypothetical protein AB7T37_11445 [Dehalococcoidia bacterium]
MGELSAQCSACPKTTEARSLFRAQHGIGYCFDCPVGFKASRFEALMKRGGEGRRAIRSCRRMTNAGV